MRPTVVKVLRFKELKGRTGLADSTMYDMMNPASPRFDPAFPQPIKIGSRATGWIESEVDAYILSRPRTRVVGSEA